MSDIVFECVHCGHGLVVDSKGAGQEFPCPECGDPVVVPTLRPGQIASLETLITDLESQMTRLAVWMKASEDRVEALEKNLPAVEERADRFLEKMNTLESQAAFADSTDDAPLPVPRPGTVALGAQRQKLHSKYWSVIQGIAIGICATCAVLLLIPWSPDGAKAPPPTVPDLEIENAANGSVLEKSANLLVKWKRLNGRRNDGTHVVMEIRFTNRTKTQVFILQHFTSDLLVMDDDAKVITSLVECSRETGEFLPGETLVVTVAVSEEQLGNPVQVEWLPGIWKRGELDELDMSPLIKRPYRVRL